MIGMGNSMDAVKFEKAEQSAIEELVNLRLSYLQEDLGEIEKEDFLQIKEMLPSYFNRHLNQDLFVYIARDYEKIVSCAFLLIVEKPMSPAFITGKTGTVLNVYTKSNHRNKGYAKQLMTMLLEDAAKMNLSNIELKATEEGHHLYQMLGFEDVISKYHNMQFLMEK